jgi:hypothetical protein
LADGTADLAVEVSGFSLSIQSDIEKNRKSALAALLP